MSQHDYTIANQGFPATRADINNALSAIATNNSGTTAPSTQYAGQFWIDTTASTWTLYIHDGTDDIQFATIDTSANTVNFIDSALDVVTDTTPQLGGNLDVNGNSIVSTSNANITLAPDGTGDVVLSADTVKIGDSNANATITTDGTGDLILNTNSGTDSGSITIADGANGAITVAPNGTGKVVISGANVDTTFVTGATAETSIAGGDSLLIFDDSASALRKMTRTNFVSGLNNAPAFMAHNNGSTTQSCATATTVEVTNFTTEMFDSDSAFNTSTGRFTPQVAGKYFFTASIYGIGGGAVNFCFMIIGKNNSTSLNQVNEVGFMDRNPLSAISVNGIIEMNGTTDFVSVFFHQQSGVSQTIGGASGASLHFFGGYRLIGA
jgi:hypothetical protein